MVYLFYPLSLSTEDIQARMAELDVLDTLTSDPTQFTARMHSDVYPTIAGTDHARLVYYYSLLEGCQVEGTVPVTADTHVKLLKKISAVAEGQYLLKQLVSMPEKFKFRVENCKTILYSDH